MVEKGGTRSCELIEDEGLLRKVCTFQMEHVILQECYKFSMLNLELVLRDKNHDSVCRKQCFKYS